MNKRQHLLMPVIAVWTLLPMSCSLQEEIPACRETVSRFLLSCSANGETASTIDGRYGTLTIYAYKGTDLCERLLARQRQ